MRYLITISYDGSKFNGFQRLKENDSVQYLIEKALSKIAKKEIVIKGAGRTDRGVHAYSQKAHFDLDVNITPEHLQMAINSLVKPYIYITNCEIVDNDFHARFNVSEKTYLYKINLGEYNPLLNDYVNQEEKSLDIDTMIDASKVFIGIHNYKNFVSGERDNYEAIINSIKFEINDEILNIYFNGKSFYRYMVRNLVGALISVGKGKVSKEYLINMLEKYEENIKLPTAPACGLYLLEIKY